MQKETFHFYTDDKNDRKLKITINVTNTYGNNNIMQPSAYYYLVSFSMV